MSDINHQVYLFMHSQCKQNPDLLWNDVLYWYDLLSWIGDDDLILDCISGTLDTFRNHMLDEFYN